MDGHAPPAAPLPDGRRLVLIGGGAGYVGVPVVEELLAARWVVRTLLVDDAARAQDGR